MTDLQYTTRFGRAPSRDSTPSDYLTPATGSPVPDFPTPQNGTADSAEGTPAQSEQHDGTRVTEAENVGVSEPTRDPDVQAEPVQQEAATIATALDSPKMAESGSGAPATPPGQRAATKVDTSARLGSRPTSGSRAPGVVETKVRHALLGCVPFRTPFVPDHGWHCSRNNVVFSEGIDCNSAARYPGSRRSTLSRARRHTSRRK
jgi:hypothetical protein